MNKDNTINVYTNTNVHFKITNNSECDINKKFYFGLYDIGENRLYIYNNNFKQCAYISCDAIRPPEYLIINEVNDNSKLWQYTISYDGKKFTGIHYSVNAKKFCKMILSKKLRPVEIDLITHSIFKSLKKFPAFYIQDSWKIAQIKHVNNNLTQPYLGDVKLYTYQLRTLQWLKYVENTIYDEGINYTSVVSLNTLFNTDKLTDFYFDYINKEITHKNDINKKITFKGGILADEMGLGKTITMISLLIDKPRHDIGNNLKNLKNIKIELSEKNKIKTKANLIVCPSHLAKQWYSEAIRCNPNMNISMVLTKPNHDNTTYKDILESDIVITTFQFITNTSHYPSIGYKKQTPGQLVTLFNDRLNILQKVLENNIANKTDILGLNQPIFEHFEWHRLIVDEAHELFGMAQWSRSHQDTFLNLFLLDLESQFKWYVSGTPFTSEDGFRAVTQYLGLKSYKKQNITINNETKTMFRQLDFKQLIDLGMDEQSLYNSIIKQLYCRNTKESIGDEWNIPSIIEETILLNLTNIEKAMYEQGKNNGSTYLRQICCHPNISDQDVEALGNEELSLEDVRLKLIEHKKSVVVENKNKIEALDRNKDNEYNYEYRRKTLVSKNSELEYEIKFFTNLDPVVPKLPEDSCPICICDFDDVVVTECGHYFCKECIINALNVSKKSCPMCRQPITMKNIYSVKKSDSPAVDYLTFKYGSKMGKLISMCKQIFNDPFARIIIFSQWERLLINIGRTLKENGINNVYCKGNVHQRNSTIKAFKEGIRDNKETRIIMLSLEHSASGTNLTEATHIILMDPVDGTKEEIKAIEGQAIGRAARMGQTKQVKVIRLITKGTIEEEIYSKTL
jgi:DNA repair protein RAD5